MEEHALDNLRADGFDGVPWNPPAPNGLIKTGRGFRSVKFKTRGNVVWLEAEEYMVAHNDGARISGTFNVRSHTRKGRTVRSHTRTVNYKLPQRKFSGFSKALEQRAQKVFNKRFKKVFT